MKWDVAYIVTLQYNRSTVLWAPNVCDSVYTRGDIRMLSYLPRQNRANKKPVRAHFKPESSKILEMVYV